MTTVALILLARTLHILGGVIWAGSTFLLTWVIFPIGAQHAAEGAGRWVGMIARKAGPVSGIAAMLTVLSGIYLMLVIHPGDRSAGGLVLHEFMSAIDLDYLFVSRRGLRDGLMVDLLQRSYPGSGRVAFGVRRAWRDRERSRGRGTSAA